VRAVLARPTCFLAAVLAAGTLVGAADDPPPLSVRITSPLGRTGVSGAVRIVAQVEPASLAPWPVVAFYLDDVLLAEDRDGPPFAVEWTDDNPFELREIRVEARDGFGRVATDAVLLEPFEIVEAAQISGVVLEVTVEDTEGRLVPGLGASAFRLLENDEPQSIDLVSSETIPAVFTLLIDSSQSMSRRIDLVRSAAAQLTRQLRPEDRVIVAPFSHGLGPITGPTDDRRTVIEAVEAIEAHGGTAIVDSLVDIGEWLERMAAPRNAVVLITDGYDEDSEAQVEASLEAMRRSHATVYVIGIGGTAGISLRGEEFLRQLAGQTGGRLFFAGRPRELEPIHNVVAADVLHRYLVGYTPTNQEPDGTWRAVSLMTADPELRVRTRDGYQAPAPPPVRPSLEFTVVGEDGQFIDVTVDQLAVHEDGIAQTVESFQEAVSPLSLVMALDASGSMKGSTDAVLEAARRFIGALRADDRLAVILFADGSLFAHDLTLARQMSLEALEDYEAVGGTALYDALYDAMARLGRERGRRAVVVLTDGRDENNPGTAPGSTHTFEDVLEQIRQVETAVFPIGLGPNVAREPLREMASVSGGEAYFPSEAAELDREYANVLENLRRRYALSYTSTNSTRDGEWRDVDITASIAGAAVVSRGGYFAPSSGFGRIETARHNPQPEVEDDALGPESAPPTAAEVSREEP